jgi:hypothetical protein
MLVQALTQVTRRGRIAGARVTSQWHQLSTMQSHSFTSEQAANFLSSAKLAGAAVPPSRELLQFLGTQSVSEAYGVQR